MPSFLERIANQPAKRDMKSKDVSLRGTGITKRKLEASDRAYEKQVEQSLKKGADYASAKAIADYQHAIDETTASIEAACKAKNIVLDKSQLAALTGIMKNQVCCLIGAAGTGKTTLERIFIAELLKREAAVYIEHEPVAEDDPINDENENPRERSSISVSAFTGRAAQQSRKAIGNDFDIPVQTIHSLLGYAPAIELYDAWDNIIGAYVKRERRTFKPSFGLARKLPYKTFIIDEASMVSIPLFNELIDAMEKDCRIILVGDIHQLPPVMSKSVLGYALQKWPVFELTTIHRQAEGNAIISNSQRILQGKMPLPAKNFHLIKAPPSAGGQAGMQTYIRQCVTSLAKIKKFDPYRDAIIVGNSNEDIMISAPALNEFFVTTFNAEKTVNNVIVNKRINIHTGTGPAFYAIGDKVMMGQNINTVNPPITNGMMGVVESINVNGRYDVKRAQVDISGQDADNDKFGEKISLDMGKIEFSLSNAMSKEKKEKEEESMDQRQASHVMTIKFETGQTHICSTAGDYRKISYGYAITCHKSQGGEYPSVIICIHSAMGQVLSQEWLYTAVTRARENVYLIYNDRGLERALTVQKIKGKTLAEKIKNYIIEAHTDDMTMSNDPWNVDRTKFPILFNPKEI